MKKGVVFVAITSMWTTEVGKFLIYERKPPNSSNRCAAAVLKDDVIVGHLPRQLSHILSLRNGTINCIITDGRRYSIDLSQEGLKNPLNYTFQWQVQ